MANEHKDLDTVLDRLECPGDPTTDLTDRAEYASATIASLEPERRPKRSPICAVCPHSLWFASAEHLRCYCRLMHVVTWKSEDESSPIAACDGILVSSE